MSGDDSYSASELRNRYGYGGSIKDSDMSASQIRARHGVENRQSFGDDSNSYGLLIAVILIVIGGAYFLYARN